LSSQAQQLERERDELKERIERLEARLALRNGDAGRERRTPASETPSSDTPASEPPASDEPTQE
jgi:hypothetical protein